MIDDEQDLDDEYEEPPTSRDRYRRTRDIVTSSDAISAMLRANGLPVPDALGAFMGEVVPPPPLDHDALARARRPGRLAELGWPKLALRHAQSAQETPAITAVRRWLMSGRSMLVLAGGKGTGKTVAAAWAALHRDGAAAMRFARAAAVARVGRYSDGWGNQLSAPTLCIDDLGAEYLDGKGSFLVDLDELVDTFYSDERPLIITTNLTGDEMRVRYKARIVDRITECAEWANVDGESLRRRETLPWEEP